MTKAYQTIINFMRKNAVMCIALTAAFITAFFVPPDKKYLEYFDLKTLSCLFATLAVVCALNHISFFNIAAEKIVAVCGTVRGAVLALVYITFIGSMLIANDMALITFLPLGYFVLSSTDNRHHMAFTFIMQNIASNLGGMLTPFGNPQNLYLYSYYNISNGEFFKIMLLPFLVSVTLITLCCVTIEKTPLKICKCCGKRLNRGRALIYSALFTLSILIVFRIIPYHIGLIIIILSLFVFDRRAIFEVDYALLLTFCAFFVFSGNMARIPAVHSFFGVLVERSTFLFGVLSCQVISNVPSAILLSKFTENYGELLVAVNIGGAGTLIASLASLITFREYIKTGAGKASDYIKAFSKYNFGILAILIIIMSAVFF